VECSRSRQRRPSSVDQTNWYMATTRSTPHEVAGTIHQNPDARQPGTPPAGSPSARRGVRTVWSSGHRPGLATELPRCTKKGRRLQAINAALRASGFWLSRVPSVSPCLPWLAFRLPPAHPAAALYPPSTHRLISSGCRARTLRVFMSASVWAGACGKSISHGTPAHPPALGRRVCPVVLRDLRQHPNRFGSCSRSTRPA